MKVNNLNAILPSIQPLAVDNKVELVVEMYKKSDKTIIAKHGDVFFQLILDEWSKDLVTNRKISLGLEDGSIELLELETLPGVKTIIRPSRSCTTPIGNKEY